MRLESIASGSSGNAIYIGSERTHLLVDAGISGKRIEEGLNSIGLKASELSGILITHEHADHISALKMIAKYYEIPIYAVSKTAESIQNLFPGVVHCLHSFETGSEFYIRDMIISSFLTPHDTKESVGYRISNGEKSVAFVTDLGFVPQNVYNAIVGTDTVVLESNHDVSMLRHGKYPSYLKRRILDNRGHLSNDECARFAVALAKKGTKRIILAHLSKENNTPECAFETVKKALVEQNAMVELCVAPAAQAGEIYIV